MKILVETIEEAWEAVWFDEIWVFECQHLTTETETATIDEIGNDGEYRQSEYPLKVCVTCKEAIEV